MGNCWGLIYGKCPVVPLLGDTPDLIGWACSVSVDGVWYVWNSLPFGWKYSPLICHKLVYDIIDTTTKPTRCNHQRALHTKNLTNRRLPTIKMSSRYTTYKTGIIYKINSKWGVYSPEEFGFC